LKLLSVEQDDTIVEAVEEISTVETIVQPVVEPEVDETTTLSEILETPVLEEATFTEQAKDRFNEIIDQFISKTGSQGRNCGH